MWRRGSAPAAGGHRGADELLEAAGTATLETIAVVREGYTATSTRENAVFNLLAAFTVTFGITRAPTALIRSGKGYGVLRNLTIADRRVHHFVPGIALALAAGRHLDLGPPQAARPLARAALRRRRGADPRRGRAAARARRRLLDREGRAVAAGVLRRDLAARGGRARRAAAAPRRELGRAHASASDRDPRHHDDRARDPPRAPPARPARARRRRWRTRRSSRAAPPRARPAPARSAASTSA